MKHNTTLWLDLKVGLRERERERLQLPASNFLISTCNDEVSMVHGNEVGSELAREVILLFKAFPVNV